MITLETGQTLHGKAGTATAVTYTMLGDEITSGADTFKKLAQGQLGTSTSTLYTVPASTATLIKEIHLANTTGSNVVGVTFYISGTAVSNQITGTITVPANGTAVFNAGGWSVYDSAGVLLFVGSVGPTGSTGTAATIAVGTTSNGIPGSAASVNNSGTSSAAVFNFTIPAGAVWRSGSGVPSNGTGVDGDYYLRTSNGDVYLRSSGTYSVVANLTGPTGAPGTVTSVTNSDGTITVSGTGAAPVVSRAAITGDVAVPATSNTSTLATVNSNTGSFGSASQVGTFTVNGKGLTTAAGNTAIQLGSSAAVTGLDTQLGNKFDRTNGTLAAGTASHATGKLIYDSAEDALTFYNSNTNIALQVGYEQWIKARNVTGSTIPAGSVVYITGANSSIPTIALAKADSILTSQVAGITTESIANNTNGHITANGVVHNLDTSLLSAGALLFLSPTTAGAMTATAPTSPNLRRQVASVLTSHATTGMLQVLPSTMSRESPSFFDVTTWSTTPGNNFVGDDSTDNGPKWAALFAAVPVGGTIYFPAGTYRTSTAFAITADKHLNIIGAGKYSSIIKTTSTTADGFTISGGQYWYNTFMDLRFETTMLNKTAGSAILISTIGLGANAQQAGINIYRCSFSNWFKAIYCIADNQAGSGFSQGPGNLSVWSDLDISITGSTGPVNSRGIHINGAGTNNMIANTFINMGFPPFQVAGTAGIEINASGAIQFINGEFIGGTNTMLLSADATTGTNNSVAAVYATNCFFDQSGGSTVKIAGPNIVNRCKFVQCGITGGNVSGATAVEVSSSGTGAAGTATAKADGVDFIDCDIYPNGGSGTKTGFLLSGFQGISIQGSRISGWDFGADITPTVSNGYTKIFMSDNKFGATNNFTTPNAVGVRLNAGSFQFGIVSVNGCDFNGSTIPMQDFSTVSVSSNKNIGSNPGATFQGPLKVLTAAAAIANAETTVFSFPFPAYGLKAGTTVAFKLHGLLVQTAIASTSITRIKIGATVYGTASLVHGAVSRTAPGTPFTLEGMFTVRTDGGSGTAIGQVFSTGIVNPTVITSATTAIDTTTAKTIDITYISGNANHTATFHTGTFECIQT